MAVTYQGDYRAVVKQGPENEPIPDLKGYVDKGEKHCGQEQLHLCIVWRLPQRLD